MTHGMPPSSPTYQYLLCGKCMPPHPYSFFTSPLTVVTKKKKTPHHHHQTIPLTVVTTKNIPFQYCSPGQEFIKSKS